jgi:hypothetical protein
MTDLPGMTVEELEVRDRFVRMTARMSVPKNEDLLGGLKNEKAWQNYCTA